jgi:hypothetical protein
MIRSSLLVREDRLLRARLLRRAQLSVSLVAANREWNAGCWFLDDAI